jgi:hypothetical protein
MPIVVNRARKPYAADKLDASADKLDIIDDSSGGHYEKSTAIKPARLDHSGGG